MLYCILFWTLLGFIIHFYIIFGTILLTGGLAQIAVFFAYFSISKKRNIKRSPNGMKPSGALFLEQIWSGEPGVQVKKSPRAPRGREVRLPPWAHPHHRGSLVAPPTYFFLLYMFTYPANIQEHHETLFPPPQPSIPKRSHLEAFSGAPPEGALITEGHYINSMAPPMMCE